MREKILVFDGSGHLLLGHQLYDALKQHRPNSVYLNAKKMRKKFFLGARRSLLRRAYRLLGRKKQWVYYPKLGWFSKRIIQKIHPTHFIVISEYYKFLNQKWLLQLKRKQEFKLILVDSDSGYAFDDIQNNAHVHFVRSELKTYDTVMSYSKVMRDFFQRLGISNAHFFPYGAAPVPHNDTTEKTTDITFVGRAEIRRVAFLEKIADQNVAIYGDNWHQYSPIISSNLLRKICPHTLWGEKLIQQLQHSKIVLNISTGVWSSLETGVNLRVYEALAAGCFLLTDYCEELHDLFQVGQEIEIFRCSNELRDKVLYYLRHDTEREKIAQRGYEKFLSTYTWEKRVPLLYSH